MRLYAYSVAVAIYVAGVVSAFGPGADASEPVTIYRDGFGVPHVYAETLPGASYAIGYAQAEDRLEQLLQNYRLAAGTMAEIAGPSLERQDYRARLWRHEEITREKFHTLPPHLQHVCRAYVSGIRRYMADHPEDVPPWAQEVEPHHPLMLSRLIIWGWPEGQAAEDLQRAGIQPDPIAYRGSNQWLISAERSANGLVLALIDPHLSWYGPFRFYEQRTYASAEKFAASGACILGVPLAGLGHSQFCSIAMTTGGPDTADVYEETINPDNPLEYEVDGQWRPMSVRTDTIRVRTADGIDEKTIEIVETHHGPIVARRGDKAYTMAIPYLDEVGLMEELYGVFTAKNLDQAKTALSSCQLMPQNVMIGTIDGDTFYVRTGRVPIRDHGLPTNVPVPGNVSANDYQGIHDFSDLVQVTNPEPGYMHNCNISPEHMMKGSPLTRDKYSARPYLYNHDEGPPHQRAAMVLELLDEDDSFTLDEALDLAFSPRVLGAEAWQARLAEAWSAAAAAGNLDDNAATAQVYQQIAQWNARSDADSVGALSYYYFKMALGDAASLQNVPDDLSDGALITAVVTAADKLQEKHGSLTAVYGDLFRVGRQGGQQTYSVGGGTVREAAMATPRAISFDERDGLRVGRGGQTSTQIVVLSRPPRSYMVLPLGQSDHTDSGHWDDQAERLFGPGLAKDTFFLDRDGLMPEVSRTTTLEYMADK